MSHRGRTRAALLGGGTALAALLAMAPAAVSAAAAPAAPLRTVSYHGYQIRVPAGWPVYRLAADPARCVLFNVHAVYLGTPGADQQCPARAFGRVGAILVQPIRAGAALPPGTAALPRSTAALAPGSRALPAAAARAATTGHILQLALPGPGVLVTATYGNSQTVVRGILAGASLTAAGTASARATVIRTTADSVAARSAAEQRASAGTAVASSTVVAGEKGSGLAFDACTAPSVQTMTDWLSSPYRVAGTYLGGDNWACAYGNFTATWVRKVSAEGWRFIPIWVGPQAPCSDISGVTTISSGQAAAQGSQEAASAVAAAAGFGYGKGTPIYYDMEGYDSSNTACAQAVLAFLGAWTQGLHAAGYRSGVYSSADSGIADLAAQYGGSYPEPDDVWIADWTGNPELSDPAVPAGDWPGRRLHQYYGGHEETWGGATIDVDNDSAGGEVAARRSGSVARPSVLGQPDAVRVRPGGSGAVQLALHDSGRHRVSVHWKVGGQSGLTVRPDRGVTSVRPGRTRTIRLVIRAKSGTRTGRYDLPITGTAGASPLTETFELVSVVKRATTLAAADPIVLYAADSASMSAAVTAAGRLGLPGSDVTGSFSQAWKDLTGGHDLVLAVGQGAANALYDNPCGWSNPAGSPEGSTPFFYLGSPLRKSAGADAFEPSDGTDTAVTRTLTGQLLHYALAGTLPNEGGRATGPVPPAKTCLGSSDIPVP